MSGVMLFLLETFGITISLFQWKGKIRCYEKQRCPLISLDRIHKKAVHSNRNNWVVPCAIMSKHKSHKPDKRHAMPRSKDAFSDWISLDIHYQSVSTMIKHGNPLCQVRIAKHFATSRTTRYVLFANASHAKAQIYGKAMENSKTLYYLEDNRYVLLLMHHMQEHQTYGNPYANVTSKTLCCHSDQPLCPVLMHTVQKPVMMMKHHMMWGANP